ncbi:metal-dependent hydrolase family protein [Lactiplantibacillus plantarum]|uniref:metal-dependent hydrolase family protein n=1 Tax=Lactiplantibacillus plantarum TaxID=1590 RepID=UPI001BA84693|nr:amidohydrolase family protein [Lactiplantibacillus plantarum]MBS0937522.1 amidohydrolase family protein [Lactiplantibacillus plantarum]MBS0944078.1 amidohydrolase family protein [Lactiplantibacillus plantarum]
MTKTNYINASIYSSEKQTFIDNQFMTVDDATGKIIAVGTGTPDTIAEQTTDMQGKYVMPGIMNAHTHITSIPTYWWHDGQEDRHPESREYNTMYAIHNMQDMVNHGVTYIRNVGAQYDIDVAISKMQREGKIAGPRVMTSGQAFSITGGHGSDGGHEVDGVDAVVQGVRQALKMGVDTVEHAFDIDDETIEMMRQHGTVIVPTMNVMYAIYKYGEKTVPAWAREKVIVNIKKHFASITKAAAAGIPIAMGTDAGTPYNGFEDESAYEMQLYVDKAGMTPAQAIDTSTINCARAMHVADEYGTISAGKFADFIAMTANPIEDIRVIQQDKDVFQHGIQVHQAAKTAGVDEQVPVRQVG